MKIQGKHLILLLPRIYQNSVELINEDVACRLAIGTVFNVTNISSSIYINDSFQYLLWFQSLCLLRRHLDSSNKEINPEMPIFNYI